MRKINKSPKPQQLPLTQPKKPERTRAIVHPPQPGQQPTSRITFALNANLCQKAEQVLNSL
jgi:hypothetical protein